MKRKITLFLALSLSLLMIAVPTNAIGTDSVAPSLVIGGTQGSASGEFNDPDSVYVDADGLIFAGDTENLRVQVFDSAGTYLREFTGPFSTASANEVQGIGELSDGTIVVVEKAGNIFLFNKVTGALEGSIALSTVITSGAPIDTQGLAVDMNTDIIYFSNQPEHMIYGIFSNGSKSISFSTTAYSTPENIALSADYIYVSLEGQRSIGYFEYDGTFVGSFGKDEATRNYEGITIDADGFIWVVDEGPDEKTGSEPSRIIMFSPDNFTALYAFGGAKPGSAEGSFFSPDGIAYDAKNNRLLVADQGNFRIQVFDISTILGQKATYVEAVASPDPTTPTTSEEEESPFPYIAAIAVLPISISLKKKIR